MKRLLLLPFLFASLAAWAWGVDERPRLTPVERAELFNKNLKLIKGLVEGGLRLAAERDALRRADCCTDVARVLAEEVKRAAADQDGARAAELGRHLQQLLERGVAANLSTASSNVPPGSTRWKELEDLRSRAGQILRPLEESLQQAADSGAGEHLHSALQAVLQAQSKVQKALESLGGSP